MTKNYNEITKGDTVMFTPAAKQAMPILTDSYEKKTIKVARVESDRVFFEDGNWTKVQWLQKVLKIKYVTALTLKNFKTKMIEKAKKKGCIWENFGQDELRVLKKKYNYNGYANQWSDKKELRVKQTIDALNQWACTFDLSQL